MSLISFQKAVHVQCSSNRETDTRIIALTLATAFSEEYTCRVCVDKTRCNGSPGSQGIFVRNRNKFSKGKTALRKENTGSSYYVSFPISLLITLSHKSVIHISQRLKLGVFWRSIKLYLPVVSLKYVRYIMHEDVFRMNTEGKITVGNSRRFGEVTIFRDMLINL